MLGYTEKLVFSFADISLYKKVENNLKKNNIAYREWEEEMMVEFAQRLAELNHKQGWNYKLATCGETIELKGIEHNHCVDDSLMIRLANKDKILMDYLCVEIKEVEFFIKKYKVVIFFLSLRLKNN